MCILGVKGGFSNRLTMCACQVLGIEITSLLTVIIEKNAVDSCTYAYIIQINYSYEITHSIGFST
jgi:hypothetical protein